ncbi:MAG: NADH-quinone oxidoreductase subunit J [Verrucomicrobia bacterium]|nr:NADH-quinone oxidoreductase subunit J [Verrucomicrobiota bacterium]
MQNLVEVLLGIIIVLSSLGVILFKKPVHSCLSFLLTLLALSGMYLQLGAPFISAMQILVYAGAILVIFMFVIVLFQDAYLAIDSYPAKSKPFWLALSAAFLAAAFMTLGVSLGSVESKSTPEGYGSLEALGKAIYLDFFFPFEAVAMLFLVAIIGALYIGKKAAK